MEMQRARAEAPVPAAIRAWAARTPDAPAVTAGGRTLSYADLGRAADALAGPVASLGLGRESVVGLGFGREVGLAPAALALLEAGLALTPVAEAGSRSGPTYCGATCVVVAEPDGAGGSVDATVRRVALVGSAPQSPAAVRPLHPALLACVVPTAGTALKWVELSHGALAAAAGAAAGALRLRPGSRMLSVAPMRAGGGLIELLAGLVAGAHVALCSEDEARDPVRLAASLGHWRPDVVQASPWVWSYLIGCGWAGCPDLTAVTAGDSPSPWLAGVLASRVGRLVTTYGAAEVGFYAAAADAVTFDTAGRPTVGEEAGATMLRIVDDDLRPVGPGEAGELCLAGPAVARAYAGRPALTAATFVPDPLAPYGGVMMRTGDRAVVGHDGTVRFHGRADERCLAGMFDIDRSDVRRAVNGDAAVAGCVVTWHDTDEQDEAVLVAHVLPSDADDPEGMRRAEAAARRAVSAFPVATRVVVWRALPLLANGRPDRHRLTARGRSGGARPTSDEEKAIAAAWSELLGVASVGADDDFFDLGGHSLALMQLAARLEAAFGLAVPMAALFSYTTVASQATLVEELYQEVVASLAAHV